MSPAIPRPRSPESPLPYFAQRDTLEVFPETSTVGEERVHLLHEAEGIISPDETLQDVVTDDEDTKHLSWWRKPSPIWMLLLVPFTAIATSSIIAPRVEIYTLLVCSVLKPEYLASGATVTTVITSTGNARCAADPAVQKAVAELQTVLAACQGILSCLTAGAWGRYSDRKGRTRVLGISVWGILINDFLFILVALCARSLPGNYWVLVIGPLIEGILGGTPGGIAGIHAYVADTTEAGTRSSVFSLSLGLIFVGMAIGPTIGGLIIRFTQQTISIFYMTTTIHFIYALVMWFIIPESLSKASMRRSTQKYREEKIHSGPTGNPLYYVKRALSFLSPLAVFAPVRRTRGRSKRSYMDFRLLMTVIAYGCTQTLMASYPFKFQYAAATFGWSSEMQGYWLSLVSSVRALYLAVLLPFIIKFFKTIIARREGVNGHVPQRTDISFVFDLGLARTSLFFDMISYFFLGVFAKPLAFIIFNTLAAFGAGFSPAAQALALDLYKQQGGTEAGELFGAISVISALASQVVGPFLYGTVYMNTVATFPRAIFFVTFAVMMTAFTLLCFVRNYKTQGPDAEGSRTRPSNPEEEALLH